MDPRYSVLDDAARLARDYTDALADRRVGATAGLDELRARLARPLGDAGEDPAGGRRGPRARRRRRARRRPGPALLRLRHRRRAAGGDRRRLADGGVGPERGRLRRRPGAVGRRGGRGGLGARAARAAGRQRRRLRHRRPDGELHLPGGGAARGAARRGLGRRGRRAAGRPGGPGRRRRAGARDDRRRLPDARPRRRARCGSSRPTTRGGCAPTPCATRSPSTTGRRSSARRRARSTPAPFDPLGPITRGLPRARRVVPRRRRLRPVGGGEPARRGAARRRRARRLVGHRRAQVAERPLRLRHRGRRRRRGAPRGDDLDVGLHPRPRRRRARGASTGRPSSRAARAASRSTRRCAPSAATGVAELVDRCCEHAARMAGALRAADGVEVLNDVVLNQVLVRFADDDAATDAVIERRPARRDVLARRQHVPRPRRDARLDRRLADDERRRGPVGRRHPGRRSGRDAGRSEDLQPVAGGRGPQDLGRIWGIFGGLRPPAPRRRMISGMGAPPWQLDRSRRTSRSWAGGGSRATTTSTRWARACGASSTPTRCAGTRSTPRRG